MIAANNSLSLVTNERFIDALEHGKAIDLTSFVLTKGSRTEAALEHAARGGADVHVTLSATGWAMKTPDVRRQNLASQAALQRAGAHVDWNTNEAEPLHAKFAIVDGVAYGNERNWVDGPQTLTRFDDPSDVDVIRSTVAQHGSANARLTTVHLDALTMEGAMVDATVGAPLDVETESFGDSPASRALDRRAKAGDHVRLAVVEAYLDRDRLPDLKRLAGDGVEVRLIQGYSSEKAAISGATAWVGSTNMDRDVDGMLDWGTVTANGEIVSHLRENFEQRWSAAVPFADHLAALDAKYAAP